MIEHLPPEGEMVFLVMKINEIIDKVNEYETHVHYARELQMPTSTPNNTEVYS